MNNQKPILVAGPCSAESFAQVMDTASQLSEAGIKIFRAGVWKPRTRPGCFEGVGIEGLEWLSEVKRRYGMKIATELNTAANAEHLLRHGIDIAWIGARTSVNPFIVEEIASALRGTDIEVYVKNPVCPDVELWMGAIERLHNAGIKKITAIHRGFSQYGKDIYRNVPLWTLPLRVMKEMPEIPMICDPSHIAGLREYVPQVSAMAMILKVNGLFIESHINPDCAKSDARQQLTPLDTASMLKELKLL